MRVEEEEEQASFVRVSLTKYSSGLIQVRKSESHDKYMQVSLELMLVAHNRNHHN